MPATLNVAISPKLKAHADRQVAEGSYASSSEYAREVEETFDLLARQPGIGSRRLDHSLPV